MALYRLANILVRYPFATVFTIMSFCLTCSIIPFVLKPLPNFSDPQAGFETRGTYIGNKLTTWRNLIEATKEYGLLTANPKEFLERDNIVKLSKQYEKKVNKNPVYGILKTHVDEGVKTYDKVKTLNRLIKTGAKFRKIIDREFFCGPPNEWYSHVVMKSSTDLFTLDSLLKLCHAEQKLLKPKSYENLCVRKAQDESNQCCRPWSLANYVALLHDRTSCFDITEEDVQKTKNLLKQCSTYYHDLTLTEDCAQHDSCTAPFQCTQYNAVFNILHYVATITFLPPGNDTANEILHETVIFVPLAVSTAMLPYYHELQPGNLEYEGIYVAGINFGVKLLLFEEYLIRDCWLMVFGGLFVVVCMWTYTNSLYLTIMAIMVIVFSFGISYFVYTVVLGLEFFPFMNLLAAVVVLGIGADGAFIFCRVWQMMKKQRNRTLYKTMVLTLDHSVQPILITSFTTSAAFFSSFLSSITAVRCFSLFVSIAVLVNGILLVLWFPANIVIWERTVSVKCEKFNNFVASKMPPCLSKFRNPCNCKFTTVRRIWKNRDAIIVEAIIKYRVLFFSLLTIVTCASTFIVFYHPKLDIPNNNNLQLLKTSHTIEQYNLIYRNLFWFSRSQRTDSSLNYNLPLRFVWGVLPKDNGNSLQPDSYGTLVFDKNFNISHTDSQSWLLQFCRSARKQPFFKKSMGHLDTSCFIETFRTWMKRPCNDTMEMVDRSPCCRSETFPFRSWVFELCLPEAIADLYKTPSRFFKPGSEGPKFSKTKIPIIKVIVIEFESKFNFSMSYQYMEDFYTQVQTWFSKQMSTAPATMKGGFFVSDLEFYDLQKVLLRSTYLAICVSMAISLIVTILATFNLLTSTLAIVNVTCSIIVSMAGLVLLGWHLNVLEAICISIIIGLTVDFSVHYSVSYRLAPPSTSRDRKAVTRYCLMNMLNPISMAALTTGMAGAFMIPSLVLPYYQIGIFLVIVMFISWLYATFNLGAMLAMVGPEDRFCQCNGLCTQSCLMRCSKATGDDVSYNTQAAPPIIESHELDVLTHNEDNDPIICIVSTQAAPPIIESHELDVLTHNEDNDPITCIVLTQAAPPIIESHELDVLIHNGGNDPITCTVSDYEVEGEATCATSFLKSSSETINDIKHASSNEFPMEEASISTIKIDNI